MSIDRIGKKGPPTPPPSGDVKSSAYPPQATRTFEASKAEPAIQAGPVEAPRAALERLRAGEIDLNGYVDMKVHEATLHLAALPAGELEKLRSALRDRLAGDPGLVELVRKATGAMPWPQSDD